MIKPLPELELPNQSPDTTYQEYLENNKFCIQHCNECRNFLFYPRLCCPHCTSVDLEWREASGNGTIYAVSIVRQRPEKGGDHNVVLIDLEEGPRMMSRVDGMPNEDVKIGMKVKASISVDTTGDGTTRMVVFTGV